MNEVEKTWPMIGIVALDNQHAHYHGLIDQFTDLCMEIDVDLSEVNNFFSQIIDYSIEHFDAEEFFMRSIDYPDYSVHVGHHDEFRSKLEELSEKLKNIKNVSEFAENTIDWVDNWFFMHIAKDDMKLAEYYKSHQKDEVK
jgi:hemerythrin-like metal-binding protein